MKKKLDIDVLYMGTKATDPKFRHKRSNLHSVASWSECISFNIDADSNGSNEQARDIERLLIYIEATTTFRRPALF